MVFCRAGIDSERRVCSNSRSISPTLGSYVIRRLDIARADGSMDREAFLDAARRCEPGRMLAALQHAQTSLGLGPALDQVLFPVMRIIGTWWLREPSETDTERLATEVARMWLEAVGSAAPRPAQVAPVVLACGPGDRHTLGQEALAGLLRHHRQPIRLLNARTVAWMIPNAVRASGADAVVVVSHLRSHHLAATQSLLAAHATGVDVFYAGEAFASEWARVDIPGRYLGVSLVGAATMILTRAAPTTDGRTEP